MSLMPSVIEVVAFTTTAPSPGSDSLQIKVFALSRSPVNGWMNVRLVQYLRSTDPDDHGALLPPPDGLITLAFEGDPPARWSEIPTTYPAEQAFEVPLWCRGVQVVAKSGNLQRDLIVPTEDHAAIAHMAGPPPNVWPWG